MGQVIASRLLPFLPQVDNRRAVALQERNDDSAEDAMMEGWKKGHGFLDLSTVAVRGGMVASKSMENLSFGGVAAVYPQDHNQLPKPSCQTPVCVFLN